MASRHEFVHQHAAAQRSGRNVVPVSSTVTRADAGGQVLQTEGKVQRAPGNYYMAPYKKPPRRRKDNPDKLLCAEDGCGAFPMRELEYCTGHARSKGLIENWKSRGPKNPEQTDDATE